MSWGVRAPLIAAGWAAIFCAITLSFGRSTEVATHSTIATFLFSLAGLYVGRWWLR